MAPDVADGPSRSRRARENDKVQPPGRLAGRETWQTRNGGRVGCNASFGILCRMSPSTARCLARWHRPA